MAEIELQLLWRSKYVFQLLSFCGKDGEKAGFNKYTNPCKWSSLICKCIPVFTALLDSPQVLVAEEEKIILEELKGDQIVVEEKWVAFSILSLCDISNGSW